MTTRVLADWLANPTEILAPSGYSEHRAMRSVPLASFLELSALLERVRADLAAGGVADCRAKADSLDLAVREYRKYVDGTGAADSQRRKIGHLLSLYIVVRLLEPCSRAGVTLLLAETTDRRLEPADWYYRELESFLELADQEGGTAAAGLLIYLLLHSTTLEREFPLKAPRGLPKLDEYLSCVLHGSPAHGASSRLARRIQEERYTLGSWPQLPVVRQPPKPAWHAAVVSAEPRRGGPGSILQWAAVSAAFFAMLAVLAVVLSRCTP